MVLVDGGETHNFIYEILMERINLQEETFNGLIFIILGNNSMTCTKSIPKIQVTLEIHTITEMFYVVNVGDKNIFFGV